MTYTRCSVIEIRESILIRSISLFQVILLKDINSDLKIRFMPLQDSYKIYQCIIQFVCSSNGILKLYADNPQTRADNIAIHRIQ